MPHPLYTQLTTLVGRVELVDMLMFIRQVNGKPDGNFISLGYREEQAVARELLALMQESVAAAARALELSARLTDRELEVCQHLALTNVQIAEVLGCSERTVKAHISAAMEKTGAKWRAELALMLAGQEAKNF